MKALKGNLAKTILSDENGKSYKMVLINKRRYYEETNHSHC
jgi:hypothetical protein